MNFHEDLREQFKKIPNNRIKSDGFVVVSVGLQYPEIPALWGILRVASSEGYGVLQLPTDVGGENRSNNLGTAASHNQSALEKLAVNDPTSLMEALQLSRDIHNRIWCTTQAGIASVESLNIHYGKKRQIVGTFQERMGMTGNLPDAVVGGLIAYCEALTAYNNSIQLYPSNFKT